MARRSGVSLKCVEEKRRQLPIYQHYILSPGKTKSHHPEAKCVHCQKEFVCGSKQRLIRHIRKCNSIANPEQIIAETLNTLARNSATGLLNHSILEASNLLPSQISQIQHSATQHLVGQTIHQHSPTSNSPNVTTANNNMNNSSNSSNNGNHHTSGSSLAGGDTSVIVATSSNGSTTPKKVPAKRGRKPGGRNSVGPAIHVTTGMDGKTHFLPATQLPHGSAGAVVGSPQIIAQAHNGRGGQVSYTYQAAVASTTAPANAITAPGAHLNTSNSGHLPCATPNHHSSPFKLNSELIDKAYLKLVLTRNLPLSLCDTKEFQAWLKTFANDYKPPSSINLIAQNLKQEAHYARGRVTNIIAKAPKKTINLELHAWPDELRGHSWYAIIAGIEHKRFLVSIRDVLGPLNKRASLTEQGTQDVSAEKLFSDFISENIKRVSSDRINSLILSGKRNVDPLVDRARESLYSTNPSIVTYHCWWHFTNILCSDVVEHNETFLNILRKSNSLISFINRRPQLLADIEKFGPFAGASGNLCKKRDLDRWYSHLVCYLFQYLKNNNEGIRRNLKDYSGVRIASFNNNSNDNNNNNSSTTTSESQQPNAQQQQQQEQTTTGTQANPAAGFSQPDSKLEEVKSIVMSTEYWEDLDSALVYLKSFQDIVALTPNVSNNSQTSNGHSDSTSAVQVVTPVISPITCNNLSLSEYMDWFLKYGKSLIDSWKQSSDINKYNLIDRFLQRFSSSINEFKLLFAAYLLNPKHRCAYMTQRAKDAAIEEILNIASEFMPEESDGHTIFDQWKLYLIREEPYDMTFDDSRTPLEWWMSVPCAESIRRVALRILRLKAFSSPRPDTIFAPLYFYEDETKSQLEKATYEDVAVLRYYYDYEDKINAPQNQGNSNHHANNALMSNGFTDRAHVGNVHESSLAEGDNPEGYLPSGPLEGMKDGPMSRNAVDQYNGQRTQINNNINNLNDTTADGVLDNLPDYEMFCAYIDFNDSGIQIVTEEPIEKKRRKWTAQEILSKCQSNNHNNNNNNNH